MTPLRTTVQSFDLFDTLIARACVTPERLFDELETALSMPEFAAQRMAAEQQLAATGRPFGLDSIYETLRTQGYCDARGAQRLMRSEVEAEFDNAIPIAQNLSEVRDHDLVVSDMYLSPVVLRGLLQHVGLRRHVHLVVSNTGKHQGTIWPQLTRRWLLLQHTGDNIHADIDQAQRFGIATRHYTGASLSHTEHYLHGNGLPRLARLIRQLRLANPFQPAAVESDLWNHFVQFNVPLLCLAAQAARTQRDALGLDHLLFLSRDCHFLSEIFLALHPGESQELIQVSRQALAEDPHGFAQYLQAKGLHQALVCDLVSTGLSWLQFTDATQLPVALFTVAHIDNYQYQSFDVGRLHRAGHLRFHQAVKTSEVNAWSLAIELLNTAPHGSTLSIAPIGQDYWAPSFEDRHELPPSFLQTLQLAQAATVRGLRTHSTAVGQELAHLVDPQPLISAMLSALSGTDWLNRLANSAICHPSI